MKKFNLVLIAIIAILLGTNHNAVMAYDGSSSDFDLSLFVDNSFTTFTDLGKRLEKQGFKLQSKKRMTGRERGRMDGDWAPAIRKIYTKGGYKITYFYYPDCYAFESITIKFPSKSAFNEFRDSVPRSMIYEIEGNPNGRDEFDYIMKDEDEIYQDRLDFYPDELTVQFVWF